MTLKAENMLTNHSMASQNECPVTDHMFSSLCLCFTVYTPCLFTDMHLLPVLYYVCVVVFFLAHVRGQFSICTLDSYWCTHQNLTPLLWFHICSLCVNLNCPECVGWCHAMLWQTERCITDQRMRSQDFNLHGRIPEGKFIMVQWNIF